MGRAPSLASVAKWLPNPELYLSSSLSSIFRFFIGTTAHGVADFLTDASTLYVRELLPYRNYVRGSIDEVLWTEPTLP